jgi:TRAP-type C4-dicarboxylate transport system permease small subunit
MFQAFLTKTGRVAKHGLLWLGALILVAMMLLVVTDVTLRYSVNRPIAGANELVQFMMLTVSFVGLVLATGMRAHIKVDLFDRYIKDGIKRVLDCLFYLLGLMFYAAMCWQCLLKMKRVFHTGEASTIVKIPLYPFYGVMAVTTGIVVVMLVLLIIESAFGRKEEVQA